jgi:hypothetical protein
MEISSASKWDLLFDSRRREHCTRTESRSKNTCFRAADKQAAYAVAAWLQPADEINRGHHLLQEAVKIT